MSALSSATVCVRIRLKNINRQPERNQHQSDHGFDITAVFRNTPVPIMPPATMATQSVSVKARNKEWFVSGIETLLSFSNLDEEGCRLCASAGLRLPSLNRG